MKYASGKAAKANPNYINEYKMAHMVAVAEYMYERASDFHLSPEECYAIGLLHDIGYIYGRKDHEETGAMLVSNIGFSNSTVIDAISKHNTEDVNSPLAVLIQEADLTVNAEGFKVGYFDRLKDVKDRYGEEFDEKHFNAMLLNCLRFEIDNYIPLFFISDGITCKQTGRLNRLVLAGEPITRIKAALSMKFAKKEIIHKDNKYTRKSVPCLLDEISVFLDLDDEEYPIHFTIDGITDDEPLTPRYERLNDNTLHIIKKMQKNIKWAISSITLDQNEESSQTMC